MNFKKESIQFFRSENESRILVNNKTMNFKKESIQFFRSENESSDIGNGN